jgi:hypothetical protein
MFEDDSFRASFFIFFPRRIRISFFAYGVITFCFSFFRFNEIKQQKIAFDVEGKKIAQDKSVAIFSNTTRKQSRVRILHRSGR